MMLKLVENDENYSNAMLLHENGESGYVQTKDDKRQTRMRYLV